MLCSSSQIWYRFFEKQFTKQLCFFYPEFQGVLEKSSDEITVRVHLYSVPARVRNHDCRNTLVDGVQIRRHVNVPQSIPVYNGVVLVDSLGRSTISNKVLSTGCNLCPS